VQAKPFRVLVAAILLLNIAAFSQEAQKKVSRSEAETAVLTRVQPEYPNAARQLKIQGAVELEAMVNAAGDVEKVNIVSGNPVLTRPAAEAVKKWKFKQFTIDGKAVSADVPVTINFKL